MDDPDQDPRYSQLLEELSQKWIVLEIDHRTSKEATDSFWRLASEAFPALYRAKVDGMVHKDIPQFTSIRRKLNKKHVPKISMEIGYRNKESQEIVVVEAEKTPRSRFNPTQFEKVYEVAKVEVNNIHLSMVVNRTSFWLAYRRPLFATKINIYADYNLHFY